MPRPHGILTATVGGGHDYYAHFTDGEPRDQSTSYLGRLVPEPGLLTNTLSPHLNEAAKHGCAPAVGFSLGCWLQTVWMRRDPDDSTVDETLGGGRFC